MEDISIRDSVRSFILAEFLPGEDPMNLTDATPLVTGGILDSIATLKLVAYLEQTFGVHFQAHEVDSEHLNTVSDIVNLVRSKLPKA